jgi:hypothetical protein
MKKVLRYLSAIFNVLRVPCSVFLFSGIFFKLYCTVLYCTLLGMNNARTSSAEKETSIAEQSRAALPLPRLTAHNIPSHHKSSILLEAFFYSHSYDLMNNGEFS